MVKKIIELGEGEEFCPLGMGWLMSIWQQADLWAPAVTTTQDTQTEHTDTLMEWESIH